VVFDAQRAQPGTDAEEERGVVDTDRDDVKHQLSPDRRVRVEVECPVQHETQPERAHVGQRNGQPDGPAEHAVEHRQQREIDAESEAVDHAEAEERRRDHS
jgi:hypothetical protein